MIPFVIVFVVINLFLVKYYHKAMHKITSLENQSLKKIHLGTDEILEASVYIRTYQVGTHLMQAQTYKQTVLGNIVLSREGVENWFRIRLNLLCIFVFCSICVFFIFDYHKTDQVILAIILIGLSQLPNYLEKFYKVSDSLLTSLTSFDRIYSLNYIATEDYSGAEIELPEAYNDSVLKGRIQFIGFSTRYPNSPKNALNHITLTIRPTERVSIVGKPGSGKTTFLRSLLRLQEAVDGRIEIDGIDIREISLVKLWEKIAVITDDTPLFDSTLRHNIDPSGKYNDFEIITCIKKVYLEHFFKKCKGNLNIRLGRGGIKISDSEKKLICLCRAVLRNTNIIVIEESGKKDVSAGKL